LSGGTHKEREKEISFFHLIKIWFVICYRVTEISLQVGISFIAAKVSTK
jgi:hypothetical protein